MYLYLLVWVYQNVFLQRKNVIKITKMWLFRNIIYIVISLKNYLMCLYSQIDLRITKYFLHIYPTPPLGQDMTQGQFFERSLTGLNSEVSFS